MVPLNRFRVAFICDNTNALFADESAMISDADRIPITLASDADVAAKP